MNLLNCFRLLIGIIWIFKEVNKMEGRYKVTFEINMSDDQKSTLEHYLSEIKKRNV